MNINFNIFFNGKIKILPNIKIKQIHARYVMILVSIIIPTPIKNLSSTEISHAMRNFLDYKKNDNNFLLPFVC